MRKETQLALVLFALCLFTIAVTMIFTDKPQDPEWYKYKVSVIEDNGVLYYEVEGWDNEYFGVVKASELDSLISEINR